MSWISSLFNLSGLASIFGLTLTLISAAYLKSLKHKENLVSSLPENDRSDIVDKLLNDVPMKNLDKNIDQETKKEIVSNYLNHRLKKTKILVITFALLSFSMACLYAFDQNNKHEYKVEKNEKVDAVKEITPTIEKFLSKSNDLLINLRRDDEYYYNKAAVKNLAKKVVAYSEARNNLNDSTQAFINKVQFTFQDQSLTDSFEEFTSFCLNDLHQNRMLPLNIFTAEINNLYKEGKKGEKSPQWKKQIAQNEKDIEECLLNLENALNTANKKFELIKSKLRR